MADERGKAIEMAFAQIEKQFGKGSIMRLGVEGSDRPYRGDSDRVDLV
jgi:RecA/RadA recombinase